MTEQEWQKGGDHYTMLRFLHSKGVKGFRKHRLLLATFCRTFLPELLVEERTRHVIEVAEAYSDGAVEKEDLAQAKRAALKAVDGQPRLDSAVRSVAHGLPIREAVDFPNFCLRPWRTSNYNHPTPAQRRRLGQLIRDIFGNPFCTVTIDPTWLTPNVLALAQAAYDNRCLPSGTLDNARLGVLADALEDAGCTDAMLLGHLRGAGPHVRGCFAVDAVLGRS
jgi:hypothetical protein